MVAVNYDLLSKCVCYLLLFFCLDGRVSLLKFHEKMPLIFLNIQPVISEVACGKEHVLFLSEGGQVFSYGCGRYIYFSTYSKFMFMSVELRFEQFYKCRSMPEILRDLNFALMFN